MRKTLILALGLVAFGFSAKASDDVYVDMSVLNSLGGESVAAPAQPLFPIVAKAPRKPKVQAPKVVVNKVETKPEIAIEPKEPEKIDIPDKVVVEPEVVETDTTAKDETDALFGDEPSVSDDPLATVKPEDDAVETTVIQGEDDVETPVDSKEAELLTPAEETAPAMISDNKIYFADGDVTVNDVKKSLIDAIVGKFADPVNNKIAIMSYNFDNGEDSFRKKRISLNRAVEIRSYLLSKGFKNFSIKVINVTDDETKKDLVEISELN